MFSKLLFWYLGKKFTYFRNLNQVNTQRPKFKCKYVKHKAFKEIMQIVSHNNLFACQYLNIWFEINTDNWDFQLVEVIK